MTYVKNKYGQTTVSVEVEKKFITKCDELLPVAAADKNLEQVFTEICNDFPFGKGTARKILKIHERNYKPAAKKKTKKGQLRLTQEEKDIIINLNKEKGWGGIKIKKAEPLGDRTPSLATINNLIRRNRDLSAAEKQIADRFKQGCSVQDLIDSTGKSRKTIENILHAAGARVSQGKTQEEKKIIVDAYLEYGISECVDVLKSKGIKTSPTRVREYAKEFGVERDNSDSYREYTLNKDFFEELDSEEKQYILGIIATDGSVDGGNKLSVELKRSDKYLLGKIAKCLGSNRPIENTHSKDKRTGKVYPAARLTVQSKKLVSDLLKYGITANKTFTLALNLVSISKENLRHFWRGCIDGDGSIFILNTGVKVFELYGNESTCNLYRDYVKNVTGVELAVNKHHSIFRVSSQQELLSCELAEHFYKNATICLARKQKVADSWYKTTASS